MGRTGRELDSVRMNKLYGVWYTSAAFRKHWQNPTKRSENDMLWILYHRGWSQNQGIVTAIAWWRLHHRRFAKPELGELVKLGGRVWKEVYEIRKHKKMEEQQNSLRHRIIYFLRQQPATTRFLAAKLRATSKAVDSHLYRLRKEGIVERLSWGLYASPTSHPADANPKPAEADDRPAPKTDATGQNITAKADSWTLDDIDDGVAEPNGMPSMSHREARSITSDDSEWDVHEMPTAEPRDMPTAGPRWSRP